MMKAYFKAVILSIKTYEDILKLNFLMGGGEGGGGGTGGECCNLPEIFRVKFLFFFLQREIVILYDFTQ